MSIILLKYEKGLIFNTFIFSKICYTMTNDHMSKLTPNKNDYYL